MTLPIEHKAGDFYHNGLKVINPQVLIKQDINGVKFLLEHCLLSQVKDGQIIDFEGSYEVRDNPEKEPGDIGLMVLNPATKDLMIIPFEKVSFLLPQSEQKTDLTKAPTSVETYAGTLHIGGDALGWQKQIDKWMDNDKKGIPPISGREKAWRLKYNGVIDDKPVISSNAIQSEAVQFAEYVSENGWHYRKDVQTWYRKSGYGWILKSGKSSSELYSDFIEWKSKQK